QALHAGLPATAATQVRSLLGQLPPAGDAGRRSACPAAGLGGRRRAGAEPRARLADRRLARARGVGSDGDPLRRPPQPPAHPHGRRLGRSPAAQGLSDRRRAGALLGGGVVALAPERPRIYEGSRIPSPIPSVLELSDELKSSQDVLTVNFGPNHPSTHGVLRLVVDLHGEEVVGFAAVVGCLHTGFEKNMEQKSWWKAITYA